LRERLGPYATVLPTQRPSALAAWPKLRQLPLLLGALVAVLGLGSLAHGVAASTRLHRRDLALVRALGMPSVQIGYAVLWQTVTILALAVAIGAPLGTAIGITAWQALAGQLDLSSPAVIAPAPLAAAAVVAAAAVTALAMVSVRAAARKPTAVTLHAD
jgi:predicted lysophospholipase L1 biosynthesis ABC-type transport system permease subunit